MNLRKLSVPGLILIALLLSACSTTPPANITNGCDIFKDKSGWYRSAVKSSEKWGVPIDVQLAIIYQESSFVDDARPPRERLLWVIPWGRASSAYGYAQAKDSTWDWYIEKSGNRGADRDDFADAVDFIGWYVNTSNKILGLSKSDTYNQYLAYHEGHGGFKRKTYTKKPWLIKVAKKVENRAGLYRSQLAQCETELDSGWSLW
ncbi:MAG: transglycosylase SLT domain-containing protein [Gammaproteobacteria bacterium]